MTKTRYGTLALLLFAAGACKKEKGGAEGTGSGSGSSAVVAVGSGSAGSGSAAPAPAPTPTPTTATDACNLVGTLELVRPSDKQCGQGDRYTSWSVTFASTKPVGDRLELDAPDGPMAHDNVTFAATTAAKPVNGACAVELVIEDAGRTDTDEKLAWKLQVPVAGGAVTGTFALNGWDAKLKACTAKATVTGTFKPGQAAAPAAGTVPSAKTVPPGPHKSIDAYCGAVLVSVDGSPACKYGPDEDLCSCGAVTKDDVSGPYEAKGTGSIQAATFVRVARSAADYLKCELALQLADGWYIHPETFECGPAPAGSGEGHGTDLKITKLAITGETVELAWTATQVSYDVDKQREVREKPTKHALSCKLGADRAIACTGK